MEENQGVIYPTYGGEVRPKKNRIRFRKGVTLIEILVSIVALTIAVIGTSYFRYYSALDARKAGIQVAGTRIGLLLCENWKGVKGSDVYDPVAYFSSEMTIAADSTIDFANHAITAPVAAQGFIELGTYAVQSNDVTYQAVLSYNDITAELRALNVIVIWENRGGEVTATTDVAALRSFKLTTYASI